jgi:hypothetical protein
MRAVASLLCADGRGVRVVHVRSCVCVYVLRILSGPSVGSQLTCGACFPGNRLPRVSVCVCVCVC